MNFLYKISNEKFPNGRNSPKGTYQFKRNKMKTQHTTFESSTVASSDWTIEAEAATGELIVSFKSGASYVYADVKKEDYTKFINSDSIGSALNHFIKGTYEFTKLENNGEEGNN